MIGSNCYIMNNKTAHNNNKHSNTRGSVSRGDHSARTATHSPKSGFVILIAVLVANLMISLGAFIAAIAVKELSLSVSGRDSQVAFYAADAAMECALYQDLRVRAFASAVSEPGPSTLLCNSSSTPVMFMPTLSGDTVGVSEFTVEFPENPGDDPELSPYGRVRVTKENIGTVNDKTIIESRGYNIKTTTTNKRVERALEVVY